MRRPGPPGHVFPKVTLSPGVRCKVTEWPAQTTVEYRWRRSHVEEFNVHVFPLPRGNSRLRSLSSSLCERDVMAVRKPSISPAAEDVLRERRPEGMTGITATTRCGSDFAYRIPTSTKQFLFSECDVLRCLTVELCSQLKMPIIY